jgi:hypothetical protein
MASSLRQLHRSAASWLCAWIALAFVGAVSASDSWADELPISVPGTSTPLLIGGWQLSPTLFAGAVYNTNVNRTSTNAVSSWGDRVTPGLSATLDNGIFQTSVYGTADIQNYYSSGAENTIFANAGFTQTYLPRPDLTFRLSGGFTRAADIFGSSALANINAPVAWTPSAPTATTTVSPQANLNPYNQFSGAFSVDKSFGRTFAGLTVTAVNTQYSSNSGFATNSDGTTYTITQRTGFNLTPQIYAFVDPSVNWQRYSDAAQNQNGYRITAGVGTLAADIWKGEVYGGYQAEKSDISGTYDSPVFGLRIGYAPTRMWDLGASVDETLGAATVPATGTTGTASRITTALVNVGYKGLPQDWTTGARFGYVRTQYVGSSQIDNGWLAGANVTYEFWRNLGITLLYQYESVDSNVAGQSFNQHMVSLGASYKY